MSRSRWLLLVMMMLPSLLTGVTPASAQTATTVTVEIAAIAPATVSGVAVLTGSDSGTDIQVLALGAAPGTTAIVHRGTCAEIDPAPVALLGDIGEAAIAGQLSKSVPLSLAELAGGTYLIAFHEGLDFTSALACGEIPALDGVEVLPTTTGGSSGGDANSYESPTYRYTLSWDDGWQVEDETSTDNADRLALVNGDGARVELVGQDAFEGNPTTCLDAWATSLEERQQGNELRDLEDFEGQGGNRNRAWRAMRYQLLSRLSSPTTTIHYHECRRLSPVAVLEIDHRAEESDYAVQEEARDDLLSSLLIDPNPAPVTVTPVPPAPTEEPAPTQEPEATIAPNRTVGPECAGVPEWYAATVARLTRLSELLTELGRAQQLGDPNKTYLIYLDLVGELQAVVPAQRDADTPEGVQDLNDRLVASLERYSNAVTRYLEILQNAIGVSTSEAQAVIVEGNEAFIELGQVSRDVETFVNGCGVKTTG